MTSPFWSPVQAAIWIKSRSLALTDRTPIDCKFADADDRLTDHQPGIKMTLVAGLKDLQDALAAGQLTAIGRRNGHEAEKIPTHKWPYLEIREGSSGQDAESTNVESKRPTRFRPTRWVHLLVPSAEVRNLWPSADTNLSSTETTTRTGRPRIWDWDGLEAELKRYAKQNGLPPVRAVLERHAADWFLGETRNQPSESQIRSKVRDFYRLHAER